MAKSTSLTPAAKRQVELKKNLRSVLERGRDEFAAVLPKHMTPERMIRVALTACTLQPKLMDCTPESLGLSLLTASQTGLEPDGYHAHLIPYGKTAQFIPDYKGLVQLALDNDVVIDAYVVYEKDEFDYQLGTQPGIRHVPCEDADRGDMRCAYAVAIFNNGRTKFVVATRADIEKRRNMSRSSTGADSPWKKWEAEMWTKTAVKMLMKFVPRSPKMKAALTADDMAEMGVMQNPLEVVASVSKVRKHDQGRMDAVLGKLNGPEQASGADETNEDVSLQPFLDAIRSVEKEAEVDILYDTMIEAHKDLLSLEDLEKAMEEREVRKAVIRGDL